MKAEVNRTASVGARVTRNDERGMMNDELSTEGIQFIIHRSYFSVSLTRTLTLAVLFCLLASPAFAQKKPKPALKQSEARKVIAATPGFNLRTGAVKIREVGPAGSQPVSVAADVTEALGLASVEDERVPQTGGVFKAKRWRAVELRTGDRAWEEFDSLAEAAGAERVESARRAIEELVTEFDALTREAKGKTVEPLTRGPLTIKQLSAMGSSAVAEVVISATFNLSKDERGRWRVTEVFLGGETIGDLASIRQRLDARKGALASAELSALRDALEAFRAERGFYVVAKDSVVLLDHLSPRYLKQLIRIDPWHNPYRYEGTPSSYTLASDGPDGKPNTPDDVTTPAR
jgi:plasmid stabilization system protein ParE